MNKLYRLCVQHQSATGFAIKPIAHDGTVQPHGMRRMDPQLVCATRLRFKQDPCHAVLTFQYTIAGHSPFAVFIIYPLARPIFHIRPDWQVNDAFILLNDAL